MLLAGCTPVGQPASGPAPVAIGPDTLNVADAAIAGGDPDMALSVSESVLATDPHNVEALVHEGDAYYALDRCIPAEAAYTLALQYDPKSTASEVGMGRCLLKTNPQAAEAALERAVQDDPGNAAAFNDLGIARDLQGNFAGAVQPYQQALVNDPALTAAEVNLGLSLALSGNGAEALQYLGPLATGQTATPKIREDYAAALVASGRDDEARQVLSVDLPPDQVNSALDGFAAVIAGSQSPLPAGGADCHDTAAADLNRRLRAGQFHRRLYRPAAGAGDRLVVDPRSYRRAPRRCQAGLATPRRAADRGGRVQGRVENRRAAPRAFGPASRRC
jgi:Flp pilus assembly protein TadD